ncbi:hypothetical protein ACWEGE_25085 [Amycolatopsis sp. NPDC004747]
MRNKLAAVAATTVFVAGGSLMTATSASATVDPPGGGSWDHTWTTTDADKGGTVYVEENGDVVTVCDTAADGLSARADVRVEETSGNSYRFLYTVTAAGGLGSCATSKASDGGVHDLPEHVNILVQVYLGPHYQNSSPHYYLNDH